MLWHEEIKAKRLKYGATQEKVAMLSDISVTWYSLIESGKREPSEKTRFDIEFALEKLSPEYNLFIIFDYVRIRFNTHEATDVIKNILRMKPEYFYIENYAFYGYRQQYLYGNICVMKSDEEDNRGTLLELKGHGCREFEDFLDAQKRSWFDFFADCIKADCAFKRIDIAINDVAGILLVPELIKKCKNEEYFSTFKSYQVNTSGDMYRNEQLDGKLAMGNTLYIGSLKSDIYFCIYEKDYEQYRKEGVPIEEAEIKNRFEIRLKNDRATMAIEDLLTYRDIEKTAFEIINNYVCFLDPDSEKSMDDWDTNPRWIWFMGTGRKRLSLTVKPEPYTFDTTYKFVINQALASIKTCLILDAIYDRNIINDALARTEIPDKHKKRIKQLCASVDDVIVGDLEVSGKDAAELHDLACRHIEEVGT